ncbi:hypothetical protein INT46_003493 [Mucor plumbeus]|uniref:Uncharacterized protein n=1 Tax=Mucor plumbeus TaxID=97098 RepID=A0A8H7QKM4_9FUNG|nr:hypothetical protein INT46_003493 [Mucor plumbeus]
MVRPLSVELQNSIKSFLLLQNTPFSVIRKRYPSVSLSILTRYKKKFLSNVQQDGLKDVQEYLRSIEIDMSLSGQKKQASLAGMGQKHQHLTVDQWRQWVFSDETRVNLWGSDGGDILQPYQTKPHVEGDGGSVLFWDCITANGPGYGTTVMDGSVDPTVYVDILQTSLLDTLEYYDMNRNVIRFQQDNAMPHASGITQDWFSANGFIFEMIRDWPAQSPDLNIIEHVVWYQLISVGSTHTQTGPLLKKNWRPVLPVSGTNLQRMTV